MSSTDTTQSRESIIERLSSGRFNITFTTQDGQRKTRPGTLMQSLIDPKLYVAPNSGAQAASSSSQEDNIKYFDLEKGNYRTFSIARLDSIEPIT